MRIPCAASTKGAVDWCSSVPYTECTAFTSFWSRWMRTVSPAELAVTDWIRLSDRSENGRPDRAADLGRLEEAEEGVATCFGVIPLDADDLAQFGEREAAFGGAAFLQTCERVAHQRLCAASLLNPSIASTKPIARSSTSGTISLHAIAPKHSRSIVLSTVRLRPEPCCTGPSG